MSNVPSDPTVNFNIDLTEEVRPDDEGLFAPMSTANSSASNGPPRTSWIRTSR